MQQHHYQTKTNIANHIALFQLLQARREVPHLYASGFGCFLRSRLFGAPYMDKIKQAPTTMQRILARICL